METKYTVITAAGERTEHAADMPEDPGYDRLKEIITPILSGGRLERVRVLHEGGYTDMFVDEVGLLKGLPRNEEATKIYRANFLGAFPNTDPESLPPIVGTAILFSRPVWF